MSMLAIITIPSTTDFFGATSSVSIYASGMFQEFLPYVLVITGFAVGALLVKYLLGRGLKGAAKVILGGRRGRRRRR